MLKKLLWYLYRLRAMPLPEIVYRLRQSLVMLFERSRYNRISDESSLEPAVFTTVFEDFQSRPLPLAFDVPSGPIEIEAHRKAYPGGTRATIDLADQILNGHYTLFGWEVATQGKGFWQRDPLGGGVWPSIFYADVDTRNGFSIGGVKWVWELNRHNQFVMVGKAYWLTQEERYAEAVIEQMHEWIEGNPPLTGVNWTSPLELAIRLINWTWALAFIRSSEAFSIDRSKPILASIDRQARHIERHLSAFSSANNHLIGEAAGLAVIGLSFPALPRATIWREKGLAILAKEIVKQIHADGVPAEQAFSYLLFILDFNLIAWELARRSAIDPDLRWQKRLDSAATFLAALLSKRDELPPIGDGDDAWVLRLDDRPQADNARSILASAAAILERSDLKAVAGEWDEKSHWLLGDHGRRAFQALEAMPVVSESLIFGEGGYVILQSERAHITLDCGPLGYLSPAAHGHADALSLVLAIDKQPVLIDPGTYAYQEGGDWREYFRSTRAHNTVIINGKDQSEMRGDFLWGRHVRAQVEGWRLSGDPVWALGSHDGYQEQGVRHKRAVFLWAAGALIVIDTLEGAGEAHVDLRWHLPAQTKTNLSANQASIEVGTADLTVLWEGPGDFMEELICGSEQPIQGWISPRYGLKMPAPVISYSGFTQLPVTLSFAFGWGQLDGLQLRDLIMKSREQMEG